MFGFKTVGPREIISKFGSLTEKNPFSVIPFKPDKVNSFPVNSLHASFAIVCNLEFSIYSSYHSYHVFECKPKILL